MSSDARTNNALVKRMLEAGKSIDDIYLELVNLNQFHVKSGLLYSATSGRRLGEGKQGPNAPLRVSVGNPSAIISAARLAWIIHTRQTPPAKASVVQLDDRRDYSWRNLALVAQGSEHRFHKLVQETREERKGPARWD